MRFAWLAVGNLVLLAFGTWLALRNQDARERHWKAAFPAGERPVSASM
jgi:hypothetical protein